MRVIQQISEDTFVVKLDDYDLHPKDTIRIAHDYVEFDGPVGIQSDTDKVDKLTGKYAWCTNWISTLGQLQIPIRRMINVVLPLLNSHEYLQPTHLLRSDGTQNYTYDDDVVFYKDKVYIRPERCENYAELDRETYNAIKNKVERDVS